MTHYSSNPGIVRCDVFKADGKWYETIPLDMSEYYSSTLNPIEAAALAIRDFNHYKIGQWSFSIPEPFHKHAYPVLITSNTDPEELIHSAIRGQDYLRNTL